MSNDKVVSRIYETYEYDAFKPLGANRGAANKFGIKNAKLNKMLKLIEEGKFIPELGTIKVNEKYEVIDGHHRLQALKAHKLAVRYEIIHDPKFNIATGREKLGNVYTVNAVNPSWSGKDLFKAAFSAKAPLAIKIQQLINDYGEIFDFLDVLALLKRDEECFSGVKRGGVDMSVFEDASLVDHANTDEFKLELKYFEKLVQKYRISSHRKRGVHATYTILFNISNDVIDKIAFRNSCLRVTDNALLSTKKTKNIEAWIRLLVETYNRKNGKSVRVVDILKTINK